MNFSPRPRLKFHEKKNGVSNWSGASSIQTLSSFWYSRNRPGDSFASLITSANGFCACAAAAAAMAAAAAAVAGALGGRAAPGAVAADADGATASLVAALAAAAAIAAVSFALPGSVPPAGRVAQPDRARAAATARAGTLRAKGTTVMVTAP